MRLGPRGVALDCRRSEEADAIDATKDQLSAADVRKLQDECSRHRAYHPPPGTPEGFWELSFMDSQEKRRQDSLDAF